uniref:Uncharacterized protein LOC111104831 isoform X2 n=1 Tax=Crassostrea virginica TaxID=6565 RepID=A0A8B8AWN0_CRAVI|nr:uncharacterized protein LOC111104831 isoform X2 [Crassostrea virginica]
MMFCLILAYLSGCSLQAASTTPPQNPTTHAHHTHHPPRTTHEPTELESLSFYYDYVTHMMAVKSSLHICYLYKTSDQEQIDVHTSHGLHAIEKTLIDLIDGGASLQPLSKDAVNTMSRNIVHFCSHIQVFMQLN